MEQTIEFALVLLGAYLYGGIPWGLLVGKAVAGVDIREHGSGNIGFTNVLRVVGPLPALFTGAMDFSKGLLPVLLPRLVSDEPWLQAVGAAAAVVGHTWPIFFGFRGGKGVATSVGGAFVMAPLPLLSVAVFGLPFLAKTRYVSLTVLVFGPIFIGVMVVLAAIELTQPAYATFCATAMAIIVYRHRENIGRLRAGTESKLGAKTERPAESTA